MDISDFVETSLTQILEGIRRAQMKEGGDAVGADYFGPAEKGWLVRGGTSGNFTVVDFDLSVVAEKFGASE